MICSSRIAFLTAMVSMALAATPLLAAPQMDSSPAAEPAALAELTAAANEKLDVSASTLQDLTWHTDAEGGVTTTVVIDGAEMTLELLPYSLRSPDFQLLAQIEEGGALVPREIPPDPAPARTRVHPWTRPPSGARTRSALRCSAALRGPGLRTRHPWLVAFSFRRHLFGRGAHPAVEAKQSAPSCNQPWMAGWSVGAP